MSSACVEPGEVPEAPYVDEDDEGTRPITVTIPIDVDGEPSEDELGMSYAPGGAPLPIFLQKNGGTYTGGSNDSSINRSSVVSGQGLSSAYVGPYGGSAAQWTAVKTCLQNQFAQFNVTVTDVEPSSGPYIEAVFGGNGSELGFSGGVGGVAPIDPTSCTVIDRAVVYIFTQVLGSSTQVICEVAAQEIAHAISLDHEYLCQDPMTYLSGCGAKTFQDVNAQCGEYSARACNCGRPYQNSVQTLITKLGASGGTPPPPPPPPPPAGDTTAPVVGITSPAEGATLPPNTQITIVGTATDAVGVTGADLLWLYTGATLACPGSGSGWSCTKSGSTYTWKINVGSGDRRMKMRARDAAGNVTTTTERLIHLASGTPPPPPPTPAGPAVTVAQPVAGQNVARGSVLGISLTAIDPDGVASVTLYWTHPGGTSAFAVSNLGSNNWGLNLQVSASAVAGTRSLQFVARDNAGNQTTTGSIVINITP